MTAATKARACVLVALCLTSYRPPIEAEPAREDHLIPLPDVGSSYRSVLNERLFLSGADCGRMVVFPSQSSDGEYAVAVYSSDDAPRFRVTVTHADRNIWYANSPNKDASHASINVKRSDAEIPPEAALLVKQAWMKALAQVGPRHHPELPVVDAPMHEFSIIVSTGKILEGASPNPPGKNTQLLIKLGEVLCAYCESDENKRAAMLPKLTSLAEQLAKGKK